MSDRLTIVNWCPGDACDPCSGDCGWVRYTDPSLLKYLTGYTPWDALIEYGPGDTVEYLGLPFVAGSPVLGDNPVMGGWGLQDLTLYQINEATTFCGLPFWGIGAVAVGVSSGAQRGDLVDGYIDLSISGSWGRFDDPSMAGPLAVPPTEMITSFPPAAKVLFQGAEVFSFNPADGTVAGFWADIASSPGWASDGIALVATGLWSATARVLVPNCLLLSMARDHLIDPYNCVLPFTGPIPNPAYLIDLTPVAPSHTSDPALFSGLYSHYIPADPDHGIDEVLPVHLDDLYLTQSASVASPFYLHAGGRI